MKAYHLNYVINSMKFMLCIFDFFVLILSYETSTVFSESFVVPEFKLNIAM